MTLALLAAWLVLLGGSADAAEGAAPGDAASAVDGAIELGEGEENLLVVFSEETADRIFSVSAAFHVMVFADPLDPEQKDEIQAANRVAQHFPQVVFVVVPPSMDDVYEVFAIRPDQMPAVRMIVDTALERQLDADGELVEPEADAEGDEAEGEDEEGEGDMRTYVYGDEEVTPDQLFSFVETVRDAFRGKSEPMSEGSDVHTPGEVMKLVGVTYEDTVFSQTHDIFVELYAPWCAHCKRLAPVWEELAGLFVEEDSVIIAKMDFTVNEVQGLDSMVGGFPTMLFYPAGSASHTKPIKYDSTQRTALDLARFVHDTGTTGPFPSLQLPIVGEFDGDVRVIREGFELRHMLQAHEFVLLEFYAPWCGHCKKLEPDFAEAATTLKASSTPIFLAKCDAADGGSGAALAEEYGVTSYPTMRFFNNGVAVEYDGKRSAEAIADWCTRRVIPAATALKGEAEVTTFINSVAPPPPAPLAAEMAKSALQEEGAQGAGSGNATLGRISLLGFFDADAGEAEGPEGRAATAAQQAAFEEACYELEGDGRFQFGSVVGQPDVASAFGVKAPAVLMMRGKRTTMDAAIADGMASDPSQLRAIFPSAAAVAVAADVSNTKQQLSEVEWSKAALTHFARVLSLPPVVMLEDQEVASRVFRAYKKHLLLFVDPGALYFSALTHAAHMAAKAQHGRVSVILVPSQPKEGEDEERARATAAALEEGKSASEVISDGPSADPAAEESASDKRARARHQMMRQFDLTLADLPAARILDMASGSRSSGPVKYRFDPKVYGAADDAGDADAINGLSAVSLVRFVDAFVGGTAEPMRRSQQARPQPKGQHTKVIVGDTFDEIVLDPTKDVFLELYAPWCKVCKRFDPTWRKLAKLAAKSSRLVIAKMDATRNDHPQAVVSGYPTLRLFAATRWGEEEPPPPMDFHGDRKLTKLMEWLEDHATSFQPTPAPEPEAHDASEL